MRTTRFRTVRCIIRHGDRFLLVIHRGARAAARRWGLPGGRIEERENFEDTARREIREELRIILGPLLEIGDYRYKGALHKVLGTEYPDPIIAFRRAELLKIGWHTLEEVVALAQAGRLHAGFEHLAISDFVRQISAPG